MVKKVKLPRLGTPARYDMIAASYLQGKSREKALKENGYTKGGADKNTSKLWYTEGVQKALRKRRKNIMDRNEINEDWIVQRLMAIADANLGDLLITAGDDAGKLDLSKMTPQLRKALVGAEVVECKEGRGPGGKLVKKTKINLADKLRALDMLARYLGMYKDKLQVEGDSNLAEMLQSARKRTGGSSKTE